MTQPSPAAAPGASAATFLDIVKSSNPTLRELLLSDILIRFCERIPYAFVILWAMNHGGVSANRLLPGRVALEPKSASQLRGRGVVRRGGHGRFWVVRLSANAANSTAKRRKQQYTDDLKPESTPKMNMKPLSRLSLILAASLVLAAGLTLLRSQPAAQPLPASVPSKPANLTNEVAALRAEVERLKGIVPDQSHAMSDVAYHFSGLWFAGHHTNWPLAQFYLDETRSHLKWAVRIIPIRKNPAGMEVDLNGIREAVDNTLLADIHKAIGNKDVVAVTNAYRLTLEGCYACHKASGKTFLRPQIPTAPIVHIINLDPDSQWPE